MTSQPPSHPAGPPGGWDQPPADPGWAPPAGYGPPPAGYPPARYDRGDAQPGYPQPGYPQPGYPQPGYPPAGHPPLAPKPGTSGLAITALVFGIIGGSLLAITFGIIALYQIRRTGQNGRGLAIAGLVLSGIWIVLIAVLLIIGLTAAAQRDPTTGTVAAGGDVPTTSLQVGDCVNNLQDTTDLLSLPAVPCAQAHEGEVFAVFELPAGPFPGLAAVRRSVTDECSVRFAHYAPNPSDPDPGLFDVYPKQANWAADDRQVACIATPSSGGTTRGSIAGS